MVSSCKKLKISQINGFHDMTWRELVEADDYATTLIVDSFLGFKTHKMTDIRFRISERVQEKLKHTICQFENDKDYEAAYSRLTGEDVSIKKTLKTDRRFRQHIYRYLLLFDDRSGVQIRPCLRYASESHIGAAIFATKDWSKGSRIDTLVGCIAELDYEDEVSFLRHKRNDFSVMYSSRKNRSQLWLGPAAYVNHDCHPNCEFTINCDGDARMSLEAKTDIKKGDEIFIFYGKHFFDANNANCECFTCELLGRGYFLQTPNSIEKIKESSKKSQSPQSPENSVDEPSIKTHCRDENLDKSSDASISGDLILETLRKRLLQVPTARRSLNGKIFSEVQLMSCNGQTGIPTPAVMNGVLTKGISTGLACNLTSRSYSFRHTGSRLNRVKAKIYSEMAQTLLSSTKEALIRQQPKRLSAPAPHCGYHASDQTQRTSPCSRLSQPAITNTAASSDVACFNKATITTTKKVTTTTAMTTRSQYPTSNICRMVKKPLRYSLRTRASIEKSQIPIIGHVDLCDSDDPGTPELPSQQSLSRLTSCSTTVMDANDLDDASCTTTQYPTDIVSTPPPDLEEEEEDLDLPSSIQSSPISLTSMSSVFQQSCPGCASIASRVTTPTVDEVDTPKTVACMEASPTVGSPMPAIGEMLSDLLPISGDAIEPSSRLTALAAVEDTGQPVTPFDSISDRLRSRRLTNYDAQLIASGVAAGEKKAPNAVYFLRRPRREWKKERHRVLERQLCQKAYTSALDTPPRLAEETEELNFGSPHSSVASSLSTCPAVASDATPPLNRLLIRRKRSCNESLSPTSSVSSAHALTTNWFVDRTPPPFFSSASQCHHQENRTSDSISSCSCSSVSRTDLTSLLNPHDIFHPSQPKSSRQKLTSSDLREDDSDNVPSLMSLWRPTTLLISSKASESNLAARLRPVNSFKQQTSSSSVSNTPSPPHLQPVTPPLPVLNESDDDFLFEQATRHAIHPSVGVPVTVSCPSLYPDGRVHSHSFQTPCISLVEKNMNKGELQKMRKRRKTGRRNDDDDGAGADEIEDTTNDINDLKPLTVTIKRLGKQLYCISGCDTGIVSEITVPFNS